MSRSGPVLVLVEVQGEGVSRGSLQAIRAAHLLAEAGEGRTEAVCFTAAAAEAAAGFLPVVHRTELREDNQENRVRALTSALAATGAHALVAAGTRTGAAVAPRVALRAGGALLEEVTSLGAEGDAVTATRLTQLQRVSESLRTEATPVVTTVKVGAFDPAARVDATGEVRDLEVAYEPGDARVEVQDRPARTAARVGLEEAEVVVAAGRGVGGAEAVTTLVEPLAERLGAAVGATRAVVDAGWRPYEEQIGQTGKTVAPGLYVALGVSGAVQHLSGMNRSRLVVAINKDADAPIFKHCDLGVVGDVHEVVPPLLDALDRDGG